MKRFIEGESRSLGPEPLAANYIGKAFIAVPYGSMIFQRAI